MAFIKGQIPWNKGKAKPDAYLHFGKYAQKGAKPWNVGLTKDDPRVKKNIEARAKYFKDHPDKKSRYWTGKKKPENIVWGHNLERRVSP